MVLLRGGQHTNLGVASIVHPKPNDGGSGILSFLIPALSVCSGSIGQFSSNLHTHLFFSNCTCEDKFALGLTEHATLLKRALPSLMKLCGVAIVTSSCQSVKHLPCFITTSPIFCRAFCSTLWCWSSRGTVVRALAWTFAKSYFQRLCWVWLCPVTV